MGRVMATDYALSFLLESVSAMAAGILQDHAGFTAVQVSILMGILGIALFAAWFVFFSWGFGIQQRPTTTTTTTTGTSSNGGLVTEQTTLL